MDVAECGEIIQQKLTEFYDSRNAKGSENLLLQFLSRLPAWTDFCLTNTILIFSQNSKASELKMLEDWNEAGYTVIPGEKGVSLLFHRYKGREVEPYVKSHFGDNQIRRENSSRPPARHDLPNGNGFRLNLYDFLKETFSMEVQYGKPENNESFSVNHEKRIVTIPVMISDQDCFIRLIQAASELEIDDLLQNQKIEKTQFEFCQFLFSFYLANLFQSKFRFFENQVCEISEKLSLEGFTRCLFRTYCSMQSLMVEWNRFRRNAVAPYPEKAQKPKIPISKKQNLTDRIKAAKRRTGG